MNVRCPQCDTMFRVDPDRIPAAGIKARCARCSAIFDLSRQGVAPARSQAQPRPREAAMAAVSPPAKPAVVRDAPAAQPVSPAPGAQAPASPPVSVAPPARPAAVAAPVLPRPLPTRPPIAPAPPPAPDPAAEPASATAPKRASFRNQDPSARAQRLARALVSDIVAYNKEKLNQTSGAAALRTEFRDEIRKSWEEYVEQVGLDVAKSTPYFRDALNEILARGEKVF